MQTNLLPLQRTNFRSLYWDVFWFGILQGSAIAFISVYAARIGATTLQVGLLTSGPAIINLLISLPAGRWLEGKVMTLTCYQTSLWHRAGYVAFVILPWFLPAEIQAWVLPLVIVLMAIPGTALAISFNAMFADVVPPDWRAHVVGRRNALLAVSSTIATLICGQLLDRLPFPLNYQLVFGLGVLGAGLSTFYLGRLRAPENAPPRIGQLINDEARPGGMLRFGDAVRSAVGLRFLTRGNQQALFRLDVLRGPFGPVLGAYLAFYVFQYTSIPLQPIFWVRELKLTDGEISIGNSIFYATLLVASLGLSRLTKKIGNHRVLTVGTLLYGLYPILHAVAYEAWMFYVASLIGGLVWGVANGGLVNRLMERVPENDRPAHMALHNLALNIGILLGSLLGPGLAEWLNIREALFIAGGLRVLGGILLALWA